MRFKLEHPDAPLPPMKELSTYDYLQKAQAWKLRIDSAGLLLEKEMIIAGERENKRGTKEY